MSAPKLSASETLRTETDILSHEKTYSGFVKFVEISSIVVICWVLSLAIGGLKEAWLTAVFGVLVSAIAGAVGAIRPSIGVRAPTIIAFALVLLLLFY
ncbi:aa3-type cytochrome c oxidase subunit IV [Microvirga sp. W0021]|uniref:Aa3-type cytochrome c oxidase subunit IV n=1 Tax=Hohaiivirga grylli TaxID=3133970 RepID=A0ABV0BJQ0_9HYPH